MKASMKRLRTAVAASGTSLVDIRGVGVVVAAMIIGHTGDVSRFASAGHFASYNGTAPIEASSGENKRHRLNQRGNRQLNWAIHVAASRSSASRVRARVLRPQTRRGQELQGSDPRAEAATLQRHLPDPGRGRSPTRAVIDGPGRTIRNDTKSSVTGSTS
jgi:transposase